MSLTPPPMAAARVAASALFVDGQGRVLLVEPTYKPHRDIPGGYVEPGESPRVACVREVREELGIDPPIGRLLVVDWAPTDRDGDKLLFVFAGGTLPADQLAPIRLPADEFRSYAFGDPADPADPRLTRRLTAHRTGATRYLENGAPAARPGSGAPNLP